MITIEVRIFSYLREIINEKKFTLKIEQGSSISDLLKLIRDTYENGERFVEELIDSEEPAHIRDYVKFMINGQILSQNSILETIISNNGDVIAIFPPIGGG